MACQALPTSTSLGAWPLHCIAQQPTHKGTTGCYEEAKRGQVKKERNQPKCVSRGYEDKGTTGIVVGFIYGPAEIQPVKFRLPVVMRKQNDGQVNKQQQQKETN